MLATSAPLPQYFDLSGLPLSRGKVFYGVPFQNPETHPVAIFWDAAGTVPAAQPVATLNGYTVRSGKPALVYVAGDYSVTVRDKKGSLVYNLASSSQFSAETRTNALIQGLQSSLADRVFATNGAGLIGINPAVAYPTGTAGAILAREVYAGAQFDSLQDAIDYAVSAGKPLNLGAATYMLTDTLYIDVSRVRIYGYGATLDISGVPEGHPGLLLASGGEGASAIERYGLSGFSIYGKGANVAAVGIQYGTLEDVHGLKKDTPLPCVNLLNIAFANIDTCEAYVTQAFDIKHFACEYEQVGGVNAALSIQSNGVNYGENITYNQCTFRNSRKILGQSYISSQFNFSQCTFDYCDNYFDIFDGWCLASNCYFEQSNDTSPQFIASNTSILRLTDCIVTHTADRVNYPIFRSTVNVGSGLNKPQTTRSGITVRGGVINFNSTVNYPWLCEGVGSFYADGVSYVGYALSGSSIPRNAISRFGNVVSNGAFNFGLSGWTVTGSTTWNASSISGNSGSLRMVYDQPSTAATDFSTRGGESAVVTFGISVVGLANRYLQAHLYALDHSGTVIGDSFQGSVGNDLFTGTASYRPAQVRFFNLPSGTVAVRLSFEFTGGPIGSGLVVEIDDVVANVV